MANLSGGEIGRKLFHIFSGFIAFGLVYMGAKWCVVGALVVMVLNGVIIPWLGGRSMWRRSEVERGFSIGLIAYPFSILVLVIVFHRHLEVVAAAWGILAFGDGFSSLVGMSIGRHRLEWNPRKSWEGSLAFWLFGTAGATVLLVWSAPERFDWNLALPVAAGVAFVSAVVESLPLSIDDNLSAPVTAATTLYAAGWLFAI